MLRKFTVNIELDKIDIQEEVTVEALLDSSATGLVMSSEFTRKQGFKLEKIERPIYIINMNSFFNKEKSIEYMVEVNIYYQEHRKITEINVIGGQKWSVILEMLWLTCYNSEINWRTKEVKMIRYPEECGKHWKPKQGNSGQLKQKEKEKEKKRKRRKNQKRSR